MIVTTEVGDHRVSNPFNGLELGRNPAAAATPYCCPCGPSQYSCAGSGTANSEADGYHDDPKGSRLFKLSAMGTQQ